MAATTDMKQSTPDSSLSSLARTSSAVSAVSSTNHTVAATTVSSAAITLYLNATNSASFHNHPITFNIHADQAKKAHAMLKRKHSE